MNKQEDLDYTEQKNSSGKEGSINNCSQKDSTNPEGVGRQPDRARKLHGKKKKKKRKKTGRLVGRRRKKGRKEPMIRPGRLMGRRAARQKMGKRE